MKSDEKPMSTLVFIKEQMEALEENRFNGSFMVRLGYKNGGIATTNSSVEQRVIGEIPGTLHINSHKDSIKKN